MSSPRTTDELIAAAAAHWLARHDRGLRPEEETEFDSWLAVDARHAEAYEQVCGAWALGDKAREVPELVRLAQEVEAQTRIQPVRPVWSWRPALAWSAAATLVLLVGIGLRHNLAPSDPEAATTYRVIPNSSRRLVLEDGTVAELRGKDSDIRVLFSSTERRVILLGGEAYFEVVKDPSRPFVVASGRIAVRAVGTAFNVQLQATEVAVVVTEGRVAVEDAQKEQPAEAPGAAVLAPPLSAGQRARLARETSVRAPELLRVETLTAGELDAVLAWKANWLVFDETPMAEAIEAFNRHGSHRYEVGEVALRLRKLTGTFRDDNIQALLRLYELKVERRGEREIILTSQP